MTPEINGQRCVDAIVVKLQDRGVDELVANVREYDLRGRFNNAGTNVDNIMLDASFVSVLPSAGYAFEIRDHNLEEYDRKKMVHLVRRKCEKRLPSFGKPKGSSTTHALVPDGVGMKEATADGGRSGPVWKDRQQQVIE